MGGKKRVEPMLTRVARFRQRRRRCVGVCRQLIVFNNRIQRICDDCLKIRDAKHRLGDKKQR